MIEIYSTVLCYKTNKLNSQNSTFETTHLKQTTFSYTFVIHANFKPVKFSEKLKLIRFGPYKIIQHFSDVTSELMAQDGSTFHIHRNHILPYYPEERYFSHQTYQRF